MIELDGRAPTRSSSSGRESILKWVAAEEEGFGRTLEQGTRLLDELIERARAEGIGADDAFRLHDTFGFPFELTRELAAEHGVRSSTTRASSA